MNALNKLLRDDDGTTAVEYAVMLGLIFVACVAAIQLMGRHLGDSFDASAGSLP